MRSSEVKRIAAGQVPWPVRKVVRMWRARLHFPESALLPEKRRRTVVDADAFPWHGGWLVIGDDEAVVFEQRSGDLVVVWRGTLEFPDGSSVRA